MEEKQAAQEPEIRQQKIRELAGQVLSLARDNILVSQRFLDVARLALVWQDKGAKGCMATDGRTVWQLYQSDPRLVTRSMLHLLLH